jgi:hypothetical protein
VDNSSDTVASLVLTKHSNTSGNLIRTLNCCFDRLGLAFATSHKDDLLRARSDELSERLSVYLQLPRSRVRGTHLRTEDSTDAHSDGLLGYQVHVVVEEPCIVLLQMSAIGANGKRPGILP